MLYRRLAESLVAQLQQGVYQVNEKLPSVRAQAKRSQVSIATVNAAYGLLAQSGWIEAKPKSGYFVKRRQLPPVGRPRLVSVKSRPQSVSNQELAIQVQREMMVDKDRNFSCAIPDLSFAITAEVQKSFARLSRAPGRREMGYNLPEGLFELRQQVARRAIDAGMHISPAEVIVTMGAQNALSLALQAVLKRGDIIAVESPCYYGLSQVIEALGLKAIEIPSDHDTGVSLPALQLALRQWPVKAILSIATFSNPLGYSLPDAHKQAIVELAVKHDICVIEDDVYGELHFDGQRAKTFKTFDPDGRVIWCSSVSKTMDPQLRVGWLEAGRYYDAVLRHKYASCLATPGLPQAVTADIMSKGLFDRHLRQARSAYKERCARMHTYMHQYFPDETLASSPKGGLVIWFEMPAKVDMTELYYQCRAVGIRIAPGELFSNSGLYKNCFRLNFAHDWTVEREQSMRLIGEKLKAAVFAARH